MVCGLTNKTQKFDLLLNFLPMHENLVKLLLLVEVENSVLSKACFFKKLCANNKENSLLKNKDNFLTQNMTKA